MSLRVVDILAAPPSVGPDELGGKGAGLVAMGRLGLPVPSGFVVPTAVGRAYLRDRRLPSEVRAAIRDGIARLEAWAGQRLGEGDPPLMVSVRSGAAVSMPGMMDTVLDVGAPPPVPGSDAAHRPADLDTRRRFVRGFATTVLGVDEEHVAGLDELWRSATTAGDNHRLVAVLDGYERMAHRAGGIPDLPLEQVEQAISAVPASWDTPRARSYRALHGIPDNLGTAVIVQVMVLGNRDQHSATGVACSRDPTTGVNEPFGDVLFAAQGTDVVEGLLPTHPLSHLAARLPAVWDQLRDALPRLEDHFRDMCEVEFTVESGDLWFLQVRPGGRNGRAAVRIAVDLVEQGLITRADAVRRISPSQVRPTSRIVRPHGASAALATGLGACPGVATGRIATTTADAVRLAAKGPVVLVRPVTSPSDVRGIAAATGVLTAGGGLASHAAVVARSLGRPAVVGASAVEVDPGAGIVVIGTTRLRTGDVISVDGGDGSVHAGEVETSAIELDEYLERLLAWADDLAGTRRLAGTPDERIAAAHAAIGPT